MSTIETPTRVTVRADRPGSYFFTTSTRERWFNSDKAWRVYRDGKRDAYHLVVECEHGRTMVRLHAGAWEMITSWHVGISAGDLARLIDRLARETAPTS